MKNSNKLIFLFAVWLFSCQQKENKKNTQFEFNENDVFSTVKGQLGENGYNDIHFQILDTLKNWEKHKIDMALVLYNWKLDTIHCINEKKSKMVSAILIIDDVNPKATLDYIYKFYSVKINSKWFHFSGSNTVIPRKLGQQYTFPQLHAIAMKEVFRGYLKKNANGPSHGGEWEINERFFDDFTSGAWYQGKRPDTQAEWDSVYLQVSNPWKWGKTK